jgi:hypothetical protein
MSYCEIIPGETPIPRKGKGAGGLSYFSSGSVGSGFCGTLWPETMASPDSKIRKVNKLVFDILKHLQLNIAPSETQSFGSNPEMDIAGMS